MIEMILAVFILTVVWFGMGYFAARMRILDNMGYNDSYRSLHKRETSLVKFMFLLGSFGWCLMMIGCMYSNSDRRVRRTAHYIPEMHNSLGPGDELVKKWFNIKS